jgi:hypothetical protein
LNENFTVGLLRKSELRFAFLLRTLRVVTPTTPLSKTHARRLREMYRSAGWPCLDPVEIDLLALGLLERNRNEGGVETLRVTDAGIAALSKSHQANRAATNVHEGLVTRVAQLMQREGRVVWTRLAARAAAGREEAKTNWRVAMPDVFSIRNSSVETMLEPIVHEIKVHRADLLSDLRNEAKREAYLSLSSQAFYVLSDGIAKPEEIPAAFGVVIANGDEMRCERFAQKRECKLAFGTWMALAKSTPLATEDFGQLVLKNAPFAPQV